MEMGQVPSSPEESNAGRSISGHPSGDHMVLIQIAVAAAFLHHLAVRMARLTAME